MSDTLYTFGTDEIEKKLMAIASAEEKKQELTKLGLKVQTEVIKNTPVDTGRLRSSINTEIKDENTAFVGTNVKYAQAVEQGHTQKAGFLPANHLDTVKGRQYLGDNKNGIMLKAKFVQGAHMFEKGVNAAGPKLNTEIKSWLQKLADRFNR